MIDKMKKFMYVLAGFVITLGAITMYSFKNKQNGEVKCALILVSATDNADVHVYYSDGVEEKATSLFNIKLGYKKEKGEIPITSAIPRTLEYMYQKGYKLSSESQLFSLSGGNGASMYSYTLIKEN